MDDNNNNNNTKPSKHKHCKCLRMLNIRINAAETSGQGGREGDYMNEMSTNLINCAC